MGLTRDNSKAKDFKLMLSSIVQKTILVYIISASGVRKNVWLVQHSENLWYMSQYMTSFAIGFFI